MTDPEPIEDDLVRIVAPNPSPMTEAGTNTWLLGRETLAVIDPGPDSAAHLQALTHALAGRPVAAIFVTHSHLDHSPLAAPLSWRTGAPVLAFGDSRAGRRPVMERLARAGAIGGGEGIDPDFRPDRRLADAERISAPDWEIEVIHTPGHMDNHICLRAGDRIFTGDHVMGWASSLVSPPDGDLTAFMASCARLRGIPARRYYPGHGAPVEDPAARLDWLIAHRRSRSAQILAALAEGPADAAALTARLYADVPAALHPAAERNVLAHLIDLMEQSRIACDGELTLSSPFRRV